MSASNAPPSSGSLPGEDDYEERLYQLNEALQDAIEAGSVHSDSVYAQRFHLKSEDVAQARRALELLLPESDRNLDFTPLEEPNLPADYRIAGELGRGGMGVVYRVHQISLDRDLALKVLRPGEAVARRALERFKREARSLARLRHPHIASVHEVGECDGRVYFTMDLIEGRSLAEHIRAGGVTPSQAVRWMRQATAAIQYVHSHGFVHRDIKPANILIDESGDACVVDFGLAREVEVASDLTQSGLFLGTPAYMAPEQARGDADAIGEATDIYAIGAVFYECLTGKRAFTGASLVEVIANVCAGDVVPPKRIDPRIQHGLERICLKAMATEREDRYVTARALLEDFERFEAGRPVLAEPPSWHRRWRNFAQRHRATLFASVGTALAMLLLFALMIYPQLDSNSEYMLRAAKELQEAGQAAAAVQLYESAFPDEFDAWLADPDLQREHVLPFVEALVSASDRDANEGNEELAQARARRALDLVRDAQLALGLTPSGALARASSDLHLRFELLSLATRAEIRLGLEPSYLEELAELGQLLEYQSSSGSSTTAPLGFGRGAAGYGLSEALLAQSSLPMLLDERSSAHDAAIVLWAKALGESQRFEVHAWLRRADLEREALLVALLQAAADMPAAYREFAQPSLDGAAQFQWMSFVESCDPRRLRSELLRVLNAKVASQALLEFAAQWLDLPEQIGAAVTVEQLAALLDPSAYVAAEDLERRIALTFEVLDVDPDLWTPGIRGWIRRRLGAQSLPRMSADQDSWRAWHAARVEGETRVQLDAALGLQRGDARSTRDWLRAFDEATERDERRLLHERLHLELDPGFFAPSWPASFANEPPGLSEAWHARFADLSSPKTWRVRLAGLHWDLGDTVPEIRWQQLLSVREGTDIAHSLKFDLPDFARETSWSQRFLEWTGTRALATPASIDAELLGRLGWHPGGAGLTWERPYVAASPSFARANSKYVGEITLPGRVVAAGFFEFLRRGQLVGVAHELVLATLEPSDAPEQTFTWTDWTECIERDLNSDLSTRSLEHTRWLARMLGLDTSLPEISDRSAPPGVPVSDNDGLRLRRWIACADVEERSTLATSMKFESVAPDILTRLVEAAREAGGEIDPQTLSLVARNERVDPATSRKTKVLWILGGVFAFLIAGAVIALVRGAYRAMRSGEWRRRYRATSREERLVSAIGMLPSSLIWLWLADFMLKRDHNYGSFSGVGLAAYLFYLSLTLVYFGNGLSHRLRYLPGGFAFLAGVLLIVENSGAQSSSAPSTWPEGPSAGVIWLALVALGLVTWELWSWEPDVDRRKRLMTRATWIYVLGVLLPLGWRTLEARAEFDVILGTGDFRWAQLVPFVSMIAFTAWYWLLLQATKSRRQAVMGQARQRERMRRRERRAAPAE